MFAKGGAVDDAVVVFSAFLAHILERKRVEDTRIARGEADRACVFVKAELDRRRITDGLARVLVKQKDLSMIKRDPQPAARSLIWNSRIYLPTAFRTHI